MEPVNLQCSRNARLQKALVGRAQLEYQAAPIPEERLKKAHRPTL